MYAVCTCVNMCILHASTGTECFRCKLMWLGKRFYSESVLGLMSITMRPKLLVLSQPKWVLQAKGPELGIVTKLAYWLFIGCIHGYGEGLGPKYLRNHNDCSQLPHFWSVGQTDTLHLLLFYYNSVFVCVNFASLSVICVPYFPMFSFHQLLLY